MGSRRRRKALYAASLPLVLVLGALAGTRLLPSDAREAPAPVATLVSAKQCRWESATLPTELGSKLPPGRLKLAQGLATLVFESGARVTLEGPAELEIVSAKSCILHRGGVVAQVPPAARGFMVRSASAVLIDHGTEFGVTTDERGATHVAVQSGLVEVRHPRSGENLRLETGEGAVLDGERVVSRGPSASAPERRAQAAPLPRPRKRDLSLSSLSGRGRTAYAQGRPPEAPHMADPGLMLVKNATKKDWNRKAYFTIDLSALRGARVAEAALTLTLAATGLGHAAFVPDATFAVFGITDERIDAWDAADLEWSRAPANVDAPDAVDAAKTTRVGSFMLPQGVVEGTFTVEGEPLVALLNADTNGLVTFVVVRETPELREGGLVHGIAGNEYAGGSPPTLRLTWERAR